MFVALSAEVTVTLSVDILRPCTSSTNIGDDMKIFSPLDSCVPLAFQKKLLPIPVQVNSAFPLSETLTDFGGMVISISNKIVPTVHEINRHYTHDDRFKYTNLLLLLL